MNDHTQILIQQLKALADSTRLRLIALCCHGECSVSELTEVVGQSQPGVSQHLKKLSDAGLIERFRDGHRVYYRVPLRGAPVLGRKQLLGLLPDDEPLLLLDTQRLAEIRGRNVKPVPVVTEDREIHRALLDLVLAHPIGDLLDVGCGSGRLLKLLGRTARRAVGVDIDANARQAARSALMVAGFPNCTIRHGDMCHLPFAIAEFDTVILDDILFSAEEPERVIAEAGRVLRSGGRILVLTAVGARQPAVLEKLLAGWSAKSSMRLSPARRVPAKSPAWLLSVASPLPRGEGK